MDDGKCSDEENTEPRFSGEESPPMSDDEAQGGFNHEVEDHEEEEEEDEYGKEELGPEWIEGYWFPR